MTTARAALKTFAPAFCASLLALGGAAWADPPAEAPAGYHTPAAPTRVAPRDYQVSATGLRTYDLVVGTGEEAVAGGVITAHYAGWLEDGTKFDASYDRGRPFEVQLGAGRIIKGWEEGIAGMREGGVRQLVIPPHLGYGERGAGGSIPPNATLIFEVRLIGVKVVPAAPAGPVPLADRDYRTTASGLRLADIAVGTGAEATNGRTLTVHYAGWLEDGTKFDASYDRGSPIVFPLGAGRMIKGWEEGVAGMRVGGVRQLVIPYDLAYGERGRPPTIPAKATLIFSVELVGVE